MIRNLLLLALIAALVAPFPAHAAIGCCGFCPDQYQQEGPYPYFEVIRTQRQLLDAGVVADAGWKRIFESCAQVNRVNLTASDATVRAGATYRYQVRAVAVSTDPALFSYVCGALSDQISVTIPPIGRRRAAVH